MKVESRNEKPRGRLDEALEQKRELVLVHPHPVVAHRDLHAGNVHALGEHPRDVMIAQTCMGVFGMIGFSGRRGREAEQLAFTSTLLPHLGEDWWYQSQHAFALLEVGRTAEAEPFIEKSLAAAPRSGNGAHIRAHLYYENGEAEAGFRYIDEWRKGYSKHGLLHCHVSWHIALWAMELGDTARMWDVIDADIALCKKG